MERLRVYLAGPDVFLRDALAFAERKKQICAGQGFEGVSPFDNDLTPEGRNMEAFAMAISRGNESLMDSCDLIIANMTPFRGPSMDVGTAFEMGYMRAQGKPVFGYSNVETSYFDRVRQFFSGTLSKHAGTGKYEDPDQMEVENFGLKDNLMLEGAVRAGSAQIETTAVPKEEVFVDLTAFTDCVMSAARILGAEAGG
jgi:nucleoside 2-deoxyribosyltransferase